MLFRPNFCCNCGEKIERTEWKIFTSRRFCQLCETEHKGADYLVRVLVTAALFLGAFGAAGYFRGGVQVPPPLRSVKPAPPQNPVLAAPPISSASEIGETRFTSPTHDSGDAKLQFPAGQENQSRPAAVYYCGARTKKGTPCSRRVKTKGRCWQHAGKST